MLFLVGYHTKWGYFRPSSDIHGLHMWFNKTINGIPSGKLTVRPWKHPIFSGFTSLSTPKNGRVYVNLVEGNIWRIIAIYPLVSAWEIPTQWHHDEVPGNFSPRDMGNEAKGCSNYNWLMVLTILKNMKVNGKDYIPYIMDNNKCLKPPTR